MLTGNCHCGAVVWTADAVPESVTICNCSICRRYGVVWAYGHEGRDIRVAGATSVYLWGSRSIGFHFCPTCGVVVCWRAETATGDGLRRIAVNLRLAEPELVAAIPLDRFDGLDSWLDLPRDGRCFADLGV